jgi:hypothetical protein
MAPGLSRPEGASRAAHQHVDFRFEQLDSQVSHALQGRAAHTMTSHTLGTGGARCRRGLRAHPLLLGAAEAITRRRQLTTFVRLEWPLYPRADGQIASVIGNDGNGAKSGSRGEG